MNCATVSVPAVMLRPSVDATLGPMIDRQLAACRRNGTSLAVLSIGLGGLEIVKARYGQAMQDLVLQAAWNRLRSRLRASDLAVRTGSDEFGAVLLNAAQPAAAVVDARVTDELSAPYSLDTLVIEVSVRTGVAVYPQAGSTGEALLRCARAASVRNRV